METVLYWGEQKILELLGNKSSVDKCSLLSIIFKGNIGGFDSVRGHILDHEWGPINLFVLWVMRATSFHQQQLSLKSSWAELSAKHNTCAYGTWMCWLQSMYHKN